MRHFSKLIGNKGSNGHINNLKKTSKMLDENLYWQIVDESLKKSKTQNQQEKYLVKRLMQLNPTDIVGFKLRTEKFLYDTYTSKMWCSGYIMNRGCSDDRFIYFRNWIISKGKEVYYRAKKNPDSLIDQVIARKKFYDFEEFWYVAMIAFENKTGKDLYDFIGDNFKYRGANYPKIKFTWHGENPKSIKAICPQLFGKLLE